MVRKPTAKQSRKPSKPVMSGTDDPALEKLEIEALAAQEAQIRAAKSKRTLDDTDIAGAEAATSDLGVIGNSDMWKLLCKAWSVKEGWMKSTKAMEVPGGCLVQVTTRETDQDGRIAVAEAVTFVPGVVIGPDENNGRALWEPSAYQKLLKEVKEAVEEIED